jgi:hypothetical protein
VKEKQVNKKQVNKKQVNKKQVKNKQVKNKQVKNKQVTNHNHNRIIRNNKWFQSTNHYFKVKMIQNKQRN